MWLRGLLAFPHSCPTIPEGRLFQPKSDNATEKHNLDSYGSDYSRTGWLVGFGNV
jgi:hypothetical protein